MLGVQDLSGFSRTRDRAAQDYVFWLTGITFFLQCERESLKEAPISGHAEPSSISADPYSNRRIPRLKRD
jgi:hypothetical protein